MRARNLWILLALGLTWGCGGAAAPPPCVVTTVLIPEEDLLQRVQYTYADDGTLTATQTYTAGRESPAESVALQYDDQGRVGGEVIDGTDENGAPIQTTVVYFYSGDGNLASKEWRVGEAVTHSESYTYGEDGQMREEIHFGPGSSLPPERIITYTYNDDGLVETTETDELGDGMIESSIARTYNDDEQPLTVLSTGVTQPTVLTTYRYDDEGRLVAEWDDVGADGTVENARQYRYDEEGALLGVDYDEGNDSVVERRIEYTYDEEHEGRLVAETDLVSERAGEEPTASRRVTSSRTEYDYRCWEQEGEGGAEQAAE